MIKLIESIFQTKKLREQIDETQLKGQIKAKLKSLDYNSLINDIDVTIPTLTGTFFYETDSWSDDIYGSDSDGYDFEYEFEYDSSLDAQSHGALLSLFSDYVIDNMEKNTEEFQTAVEDAKKVQDDDMNEDDFISNILFYMGEFYTDSDREMEELTDVVKDYVELEAIADETEARNDAAAEDELRRQSYYW